MKIAFIGLGAMGLRMAQRLLDAEHQVFVYNRTREKAAPLVESGATLSDSPREAAEKADIVISMVTDIEASKEVWLDAETGAVHGLKKGSVAVESSTLTPRWMNILAREIEQKSEADFLDAPVVGSRPQAEAGQLVYLVGGETRVFDNIKDVLAVMGAKIFHTGEVGTATAVKLAVNALFGIQTAALAEMLEMLKKSGVETTDALEILNELPVMSPAAKRIGGLIAERNFSPNFPIHLVAKDFDYVIENAKDVNALAPLSGAVQNLFALASQNYGDDDVSGIYQIYEESTESANN
jgi:3-hydroxyisobutyrate dehydrogenase